MSRQQSGTAERQSCLHTHQLSEAADQPNNRKLSHTSLADRRAQQCHGTHLCLPLSPKASGSSEGRNAALGAHTGSGNDGDMLCFGKHFSEISHVCLWDEKMSTFMMKGELLKQLHFYIRFHTMLPNAHAERAFACAQNWLPWLPHTLTMTSISEYFGFFFPSCFCMLEFERQFLEAFKNNV